MPDSSTNLELPYLLASQSQKHVTYNELVNKIDALLMLSVTSNSQTTPPITPSEGQRFIIPAGANGIWAGKIGKIAIYQNLGWIYATPKNGFIAYAENDGQLYLYNGAWVNLSQTIPQNSLFTQLGIGTSPDTNNPLAVKLNNTLFTAKYSNESGDGNLRFKVNKENTGKTASFLFQNNWSGRAEFGLIGDDNFSIKLSSDGNNWTMPIKIDNGGNNNIAIGNDALKYKIDGSLNTDLANCVGIGSDARVSASNQIQLGNSSTTTYAYGAVQNRSDRRDKTDIRDTILGLDFICALRPVDFRWDIRDDYFIPENIIDENGNQTTILKPIPRDNSKKRNRYHHGLIAQEVQDLIQKTNTDFGGYQNHTINGGADTQSLAYTELIAPIIKAIQELRSELDQTKFK